MIKVNIIPTPIIKIIREIEKKTILIKIIPIMANIIKIYVGRRKNLPVVSLTTVNQKWSSSKKTITPVHKTVKRVYKKKNSNSVLVSIDSDSRTRIIKAKIRIIGVFISSHFSKDTLKSNKRASYL